MKNFNKLQQLVLCLTLVLWIGIHEKICASEVTKADIISLLDEVDISGTVVNSEGEPLIGVNILVKGTNNGTSTDFEGTFTLAGVEEDAVLVVSYLGYQTQEIPVNGKSNLKITMVSDSQLLDEIVVFGYSTERKVDLTGAVSVVDVKDIKSTPTSNPIKSLQGRVPGLFISTSGNPNGAATVRVRGVSTLNDNNPLYIIDGVPTKTSAFQVLNAEDIESIQVLKDAASAAIYGARSSNGVIIITTNQGSRENKTSVNITSRLTQSKYTAAPQLLDVEGRARVQWQAMVNDGLNPDNAPHVSYNWYRDSDGTAILNSITIPNEIAPGIPSANTNWYDQISRNGFIQEHNLSFASGGKYGRTYMSLGYLGNKYIAKFKNYNKYSARLNSTFNIMNDKIKLGQNIVITNAVDNGDASTRSFSESIQIQPILPVKLPNGEYSGPVDGSFVDHPNPLMVLDLNKWDQRNDWNVFGNLFLNYTITENLVFNTLAGIERSNGLDRNIEISYSTGFINQPTTSLKNSKSHLFNWNWNATLKYNNALNKNNFSGLIGTELIKNQYSYNSTYKEEFALETLDYMVESAGSGIQTVSGGASASSLLSYFGKVNYSFDNKYLLSATMRIDGSSRFGENNKFGYFPAFSAGWKIDQEKLVVDNLRFISNLKLRGGWGKTGNQEISNIARFGLYEAYYGLGAKPFTYDNGTAYDLKGADSGPLASGFRRIQTGNENLKWEVTSEVNLGLDFGFWNQAINGSIDYFIRNTSDILISPAYLAVIGEGGNRFLNGASVQTEGFEIIVSYNSQFSSFDYSITGNMGHYNDKITSLPEAVIHSYPGNSEQTILGKSMNSNFGYIVEGIFQNQSEVEAHASQPGKGIGRLKFKDLNEDGTINTLDQKYIGSRAPRYSFGLNLESTYKKFSARIFLQGVSGLKIVDARKRFTDFTFLWAGTNYGIRTLDAWTPENSESMIPSVSLTDNNNEGRSSTYHIANGSYLKLREINIGYQLNSLFNDIDFQIFISGENILTIKHKSFTSPDPENPGYNFPIPRKITLGVDIKL